MTRFARLLILLLALGLSAAPAAAQEKGASPTILISIDGFRADYLGRGVTPTLSRLAAEGASAAMRPSFPSVTFPNHYTLVTGLRPDRNGIVANTMVDPAIPERLFKLSDPAAVTDRRWWDEAEPIWVTAEKQGIRTGTMFWPGSEADIHGVRPSYWVKFDKHMASNARTDQVLAWLDLPAEKRPRLITLYFDAVDTAGHLFGPNSPQVNAAAAEVDAAVARLLDGLKARGLSANLIIVADHGMAEVSLERRIFLDSIVPTGEVRALTMGPVAELYINPAREAAVVQALLSPHEHMRCWKKADIPAPLHYGRNPRVPPVVCLADAGWEITTHDYRGAVEHGDHGYDPADPSMAALFIAEGPAFAHGVKLASFDNVDVYPLLAHVAGVRPLPGDGKLQEVSTALAH